jgi:hypothetical protein
MINLLRTSVHCRSAADTVAAQRQMRSSAAKQRYGKCADEPGSEVIVRLDDC